MILLEFLRVKRFILIRVVRVRGVRAILLFVFSVIMVSEARMGMGLIVRLARRRGDESVEI